MCRVFGFRSAFPSAVHNSLLRARNALTVQSRQHPDGWGIVFFDAGEARQVRGTGPAFLDGDFTRAAGLVSARTVLAHVRKASVGSVREANCHPFLRGPYAFAHNGDIARWPEVAGTIEALIAPHFRTFEGDTDSERCFALFLTHLQDFSGPDLERAPFSAIESALRQTVATLRGLADPGAKKPSVLTMVVARDDLLAAIHSGNSLWYSTHKGHCPERTGCSMFDPSCENPTHAGVSIRHLLVASEPLSTSNIWQPVPEGQVVGVDPSMTLHAPAIRLGQEPTSAPDNSALRGIGI